MNAPWKAMPIIAQLEAIVNAVLPAGPKQRIGLYTTKEK
jgi:hypothetical protein